MQKPNLLILHGALGAGLQFGELKNLLSSNFNVFVLELSGHGKSAEDYEFNVNGFSEQLADFMNENLIPDLHVFGYSMGGYIALNTIISHQIKLKSLITLGTKFKWSEEIAEREIKLLRPEIIEQKIPAFAKILEERHKTLGWKSVLNKTASLMQNLGATHGFKNSKLVSVLIPVYICLGGKDNMVSAEESQEMAEILLNGNYHCFKDFPHPIEKINIEVLREFLVNTIIDKDPT